MENMRELCYGEIIVKIRSFLYIDYLMGCFKRFSLYFKYIMVFMCVYVIDIYGDLYIECY